MIDPNNYSCTWYEFKKERFVLAVCPKAGSTSIRRALLKQQNVIETQAHRVTDNDLPVVMFVRDPIERLNSCWNYFSEVGWPSQPSRVRQAQGKLYFSCYEKFVDGVLEGVVNRHWAPQTEMATYARKMLVTDPFEFSKINELWDVAIGYGKLEKLNPAKDYELDYYREGEIKKFYAGDYKLIEEARCLDLSSQTAAQATR